MTIALIAVASAAPTKAEQVGPNDYLFKGNIKDTDLPPGLSKRPPPGSSAEQVDEILKAQPNIVLDGATLEITAPAAGSTRTLMINTLELRNGAAIRLRGTSLELDAHLLVSDGGKFEGFSNADDFPAVAPDGQAGMTGLSAGTLVLETAINRNDLVYVSLGGQNGQPGGKGLRGTQGAKGPRGDNGADHLFDCARGGGSGGTGSRGGTGGTGGRGGSGGNGGKLILRGQVAAQRSQITFTAPGGHGAKGGLGGSGGPGGPGGDGGGGTTYCRGGAAGNPGVEGPSGEEGPNGEEGERGSIFAG
ncbi:hypothetical protein HAP47_0005240 [Bradyrhizobium sp. 41S5]|uniref:hypothetical protein n=1 Tax=Bradyrhizobium sp. 41S5 TaxID=1404443 RepID=UPI00156AFB53|nr:hypothetical protein [Bradyrhizobium sp. 41S5]UFX49315.1 hypothetical protein HAP47_0005240 [Bradyrhizobium sp. 41S5]